MAEYIEQLETMVDESYAKQQVAIHDDAVTIDLRLTQLRSQIRQAVDKIKFLSSETSIRYMEEDITKLETAIKELEHKRQESEPQKAIDIDKYKLMFGTTWNTWMNCLSTTVILSKKPNILALFSTKRQATKICWMEPQIFLK